MNIGLIEEVAQINQLGCLRPPAAITFSSQVLLKKDLYASCN